MQWKVPGLNTISFQIKIESVNRARKFYTNFTIACNLHKVESIPIYKRLPRLEPLRRVLSVGIGVTSSILPIFNPARARARRADWAPGPGDLVRLPPVIILNNKNVYNRHISTR